MYDPQLLKERFGIPYLRPYQELIISRIMECAENGKNARILAVMPTGSGKSLCFMYPAAALERRCIIIYPLLSLMNDQEKRFREAGIPAVILRGGLGQEERRRRIECIRQNEAAAVITNPETLLSLMKGNGIDVIAKDTELLVIDEAHTAVTWGSSFRPSYLEIGRIINRIRPRSILAFTATMDSAIEEGIEKHIFSGIAPYMVHCSADRENIFYHAVKSLSKIRDTEAILSKGCSRPAVIFCRSRLEAERTAEALSPSFSIRSYHAGMERERKEEVEKWFLHSSDGVLASTKAYGLGVDKKDIRTVVHLSVPETAPDFLQEAGRGGRDGKRMDSYVLYSDKDLSPIARIFTSGKCIRRALLREMGENPETEGCLACSVCIPDHYRRAGEDEILSWIRFHPFIKEGNAALSLTASHPFLRRHRLPRWKEEEALEAIRILADEGRIRRIAGHLVLPMRPCGRKNNR